MLPEQLAQPDQPAALVRLVRLAALELQGQQVPTVLLDQQDRLARRELLDRPEQLELQELEVQVCRTAHRLVRLEHPTHAPRPRLYRHTQRELLLRLCQT